MALDPQKEIIETWVPSLGWEDPLEKVKAIHSSIWAWRIPWTSPWGREESDTTERLSLTRSHAALITAIELLFIIMNSIITVRSFSSPLSCFRPSSTHWINYCIRRVWGTQPEHPLAREELRAVDSKCVIFLWWRLLSMQNPWRFHYHEYSKELSQQNRLCQAST